MKELIEVLLLVFIILGSLIVARNSITGQLKMSSFVGADYELFTVRMKYFGIVDGLKIAAAHELEDARWECNYEWRIGSELQACLKSKMPEKLKLMNESIESALEHIQQLGKVQYGYYIYDYKPLFDARNPDVVGIPVHIYIRSKDVELDRDEIIYVDAKHPLG